VQCKIIEKNKLKAQVAVRIPEWHLTIFEIRIYEDGVKRWISLPCSTYDTQEKKVYVNTIKFDTSEINRKFRDSVLMAFDEFIKKLGNE